MWHDAETEDIPDALWPTDEGATVHVSLSRREAEAFLLAIRNTRESSTALLTADSEIRHAIRSAFPELDGDV
jgi:predicted DNA-binding transcriptional regulator YafY